LKSQNPGWSVGDIAKELGKQWAAATADDKKKYNEKSEKEKEKYLKVFSKLF